MLEEPPEHVIFVLATTERHKVLPTIISRCQSFDFRRPGVETIKDKLAEIAEAEGIEVEPEALTVIAREARGSFRDAEGLLDQISSFAEAKVTAAMVRELLGSVGPEALLETTSALKERRAADALRIIDRLSNEGRDLGQFLGELISHLRNLMLLPYAPQVALAEVGADERGPLEEQAKSVPTAELVRLIESLGDTLGRIKRGGDPKLELELSFLKLTRDYVEPQVDVLLRRLETLELAIERGEAASQAREIVAPEPTPQETPSDAGPPEEVPEVEGPKAERPEDGGPEDTEPEEGIKERPDLAAHWEVVMQDLRDSRQAPAAAIYEEARVQGFDGEVLELAFPEDLAIYARLARDDRHADPLREALGRRFGLNPRIECRVTDGSFGAADATPLEQTRRAVPAVEPEGPPLDTQEAHNGGKSEGSREPEAVSGATGAEDLGRAPGEAEGDDIIRDQREVFEIARERLGLFDQDKGS
jgi:DNA polymerase III subunit gamma/tau